MTSANIAKPPPATAAPGTDAAALRRVLGSFAGDGELAEDHLEIAGGELGNRRMLFRRMARDQPGKLSLQTIKDVRVRMDAAIWKFQMTNIGLYFSDTSCKSSVCCDRC